MTTNVLLIGLLTSPLFIQPITSLFNGDNDERIKPQTYGSTADQYTATWPINKVRELSNELIAERDDKTQFIEGDMRITPLLTQIRAASVQSRHLFTKEMKWKSNIIPYFFDATLTEHKRGAIVAAMKDFHQYTIIRFVQRTTETDYLNFIKEKGCWSFVGCQGGKQDLSIGNGCGYRGTVIHEIMHALGFFHEHTRVDRENFLTIQSNNIESGYAHNFEKYENRMVYSTGDQDKQLFLQYDYFTIMHLGCRAFNSLLGKTIEAKDDEVEDTDLGQRDGFSKSDIERLKAAYGTETNGNPNIDTDPSVAISTNLNLPNQDEQANSALITNIGNDPNIQNQPQTPGVATGNNINSPSLQDLLLKQVTPPVNAGNNLNPQSLQDILTKPEPGLASGTNILNQDLVLKPTPEIPGNPGPGIDNNIGGKVGIDGIAVNGQAVGPDWKEVLPTTQAAPLPTLMPPTVSPSSHVVMPAVDIVRCKCPPAPQPCKCSRPQSQPDPLVKILHQTSLQQACDCTPGAQSCTCKKELSSLIQPVESPETKPATPEPPLTAFPLSSLTTDCSTYPCWPRDYVWSSDGLPPNCNCGDVTSQNHVAKQPVCRCNCVKIHTDKSDISWNNNLLCFKDTPSNPQFVISKQSNMPLKRCLKFPSSSRGWENTYFCMDAKTPYHLFWSRNENDINKADCLTIFEPNDEKWNKMYLCNAQ